MKHVRVERAFFVDLAKRMSYFELIKLTAKLHQFQKIMKTIFFVAAFFFFTTNCLAQSRIISKDEYEKVFQYAVSNTNAEYPHIFTITDTSMENGKTIRTETEVRENESPGYERIKITTLADGRETNKYQIKIGYGNVFCSDDMVTWKSSKYECNSSRMLLVSREPESIEYSLSAKILDGKKVKLYRKYSVFVISKDNKKFNEEIATLDSRGYFLTIVKTDGTVDPKTVTLIRKQSWIAKAKFKPIVTPIK
jgi:hypothetical protein